MWDRGQVQQWQSLNTSTSIRSFGVFLEQLRSNKTCFVSYASYKINFKLSHKEGAKSRALVYVVFTVYMHMHTQICGTLGSAAIAVWNTILPGAYKALHWWEEKKNVSIKRKIPQSLWDSFPAVQGLHIAREVRSACFDLNESLT